MERCCNWEARFFFNFLGWCYFTLIYFIFGTWKEDKLSQWQNQVFLPIIWSWNVFVSSPEEQTNSPASSRVATKDKIFPSVLCSPFLDFIITKRCLLHNTLNTDSTYHYHLMSRSSQFEQLHSQTPGKCYPCVVMAYVNLVHRKRNLLVGHYYFQA